MTRGRVYEWLPDRHRALGGSARASLVTLSNLESGTGLTGKYVRVINAGQMNLPGPREGDLVPVPLDNAVPDSNGDFVFEQGRGGGRMDKIALAEPDFRWRYVQASHFGEVNVYFHVDRMASYADEHLRALGARSLPRVTAVVNAHHAATELDDSGERDGVRGTRQWLPFQGGHYRLPGSSIEIVERTSLSPHGEIHLGPGWRLLEHGALVEASGGRYRANASHNPGIIYHEYGHHIVRHTADPMANATRSADAQDNRKCAFDEGTSDYLAAAMLETPHIWAFHHRHDEEGVHPRSLTSTKTMADYDDRRGSDAHANGTIWGAALWDMRSRFAAVDADGGRQADRVLFTALLILGLRFRNGAPRSARGLPRGRGAFVAGLEALLDADEQQYGGRQRHLIVETFERRGIVLAEGRAHSDRTTGRAAGAAE
jgi:hypothetical protein